MRPPEEMLIEHGGMTPARAAKSKRKALKDWVRNLTLNIDGTEYTFDIFEEVRWDPNNLENARQQQVQRVTLWCAVVAELTRAVQAAKDRLDSVSALVAGQVRAGQIAVPGGKVTETIVKGVVAQDKRVQYQQSMLALAKKKLEVARAIIEGLKNRREALHIEGLIYNTEARIGGN